MSLKNRAGLAANDFLFVILISAIISGAAAIFIPKMAVKKVPHPHEVQVVGVEMNNTKFWLPQTIVVHKGDLVKLKLVSRMGGENNVHGFKIEDFNVELLVQDKVIDFEFTPDKSGIFPIKCHLHPAHIGGQLVVLE